MTMGTLLSTSLPYSLCGLLHSLLHSLLFSFDHLIELFGLLLGNTCFLMLNIGSIDGSGLDDKATGVYTWRCYLDFYEDKSGSEYLGSRTTHYDGELSGIAQALEGAREVGMLAILMDSKPAISTLRKMDRGVAPRSEIEARILKKFCNRTDKDTCVAWVKGHKGIKGNEEADKLCREASITGARVRRSGDTGMTEKIDI